MVLQARSHRGKFLAGDKDMLRQLRRMASKVPSVAAAALYLEGQRVMRQSQEHFTPVGHPGGGTLKNSGKVDTPQRGNEVPGGAELGLTSKDWVVRLSYGGGAQAYALAVHEHLSGHSPYSWRKAEEQGRPVKFRLRGTGPKYLERPLNAAKIGLSERIAEKVRLVFRGDSK